MGFTSRGSHKDIKRQRIRLTIAAYVYECLNDNIMSDAEYDVLAIAVFEKRNEPTGEDVYDKFFREEVTPDTGMWVRKHPDFHNDKLDKLANYVLALL